MVTKAGKRQNLFPLHHGLINFERSGIQSVLEIAEPSMSSKKAGNIKEYHFQKPLKGNHEGFLPFSTPFNGQEQKLRDSLQVSYTKIAVPPNLCSVKVTFESLSQPRMLLTKSF